MPKPGDRIVVAAAKTAPARRGTVVEQVGAMLVVDWDDGRRSGFIPAPGAVTVQRTNRTSGPSPAASRGATAARKGRSGTGRRAATRATVRGRKR